jgi:DNA repair protein RadA/Sms
MPRNAARRWCWGHVTKDGSIAGPRVLEHMVDVVMSFEGERSHQYRILRNLKNRFGPVDEIGVFRHGRAGLAKVGNPRCCSFGRDKALRAARCSRHGGHAPGAGGNSGADRAVAIGRHRRAVVGWDNGRLAMLLAVLEARCGLNFSACEVYLNVAAVIAWPIRRRIWRWRRLVSALADKPLPAGAVWFGEVSLAGEIRPVAHGGLRLRESAKLGFSEAYGPADGTNPKAMLRRECGIMSRAAAKSR